MKKLKKAFTIVELVIVIAVIAILAAVLIPTFVNVTRNAKLSADQQAVYNMNLVLQTDESLNGAPGNLKEAREVLAEGGYNTKLTPSLSGYNYYWNSNYNIVMLVKVDKVNGWELVYPLTDDANEAYKAYVGQCYNLSTDTTPAQDELLEKVKSGETIEMTADTFSNIFYLSREIGETFKGATVQLTENLDLGDVEIDPMYEFAGTFDGNGKTISNFSIVPQHGTDGNGYQYFETTDYVKEGDSATVFKNKIAYGIFGALTEGGVVKDLTVVYDDTKAPEEPGSEYTYFGGIVGVLDGGIIDNCTVSGSIHQYNRVGGIVGTALAGTVKNCTVTANITSYAVTASTSGNTAPFANYSYVGGLIAYTGNRVRNSSDVVSVTDCTVGSAAGITLKASGWAVGAITAWLTDKPDLTVSDTTVNNVTVDFTSGTGDYAALLVGYIGRPVSVTFSSVTLLGTNTVIQKGGSPVSYTATGSDCTPQWSGNNNNYLYLNGEFPLAFNGTNSDPTFVTVGTITG